MLTLSHPNILASIDKFSCGLMPIRNGETNRLLLVLKLHKDHILATQMKGGFSFYLVPLQSTSGPTVALVTAFFDDNDEPLILKTPLFDDPFSHDLLELLAYNKLDVYFFDEHCRELMGYRASIQDQGSLLAAGDEFSLLTFHPKTVPSLHEALGTWFGHRTQDDDDNAIKIVFEEELSPSDIFALDARPGNHDYHGSGGLSYSMLKRENPGYFQERGIVLGLKRAFDGKQLFLNPMRQDNNKEFVDVLAVGQNHLLLIQAKDSPNTEASISRTMNHKRNISFKKIDKGMKQIKGAVKLVCKHSNMKLKTVNNHYEICVNDKKIVALLVIGEIFTNHKIFGAITDKGLEFTLSNDQVQSTLT